MATPTWTVRCSICSFRKSGLTLAWARDAKLHHEDGHRVFDKRYDVKVTLEKAQPGPK